MRDTQDHSFWLNDIAVGQAVNLSDQQSLLDFIEDENDITIDNEYLIDNIRRVHIPNINLVYVILEVSSPEEELWIVVKLIDDTISYGIYFIADDFQSGDRDDMMESEDWMFPDGVDGDYAPAFFLDDEEYLMKPIGILIGESSGEPTMIAEYACNDPDNTNDQAFIIEMGIGGLIKLFVGCEINSEEIQVI